MTNFISVSTGATHLQDISLNPQKLAGQCAKLKCCLNFEVDAYMEAQKNFPSREIPLETQDNTYYHFKTDVFKNQMQYSTDKHIVANLVSISGERAYEVINMNRKGHKPKSLDNVEEKEANKPPKEYQDILDESLTRFDAMKRKKKKKHFDRSPNNSNNQPKELKKRNNNDQ
jgi:hypothetical protein